MTNATEAALLTAHQNKVTKTQQINSFSNHVFVCYKKTLPSAKSPTYFQVNIFGVLPSLPLSATAAGDVTHTRHIKTKKLYRNRSNVIKLQLPKS